MVVMGRWRTKIIRPRIIELLEKEVPPLAIAERLGIERARVYLIAKEEGIVLKRKGWGIKTLK
jgi:DNA invertase Pin-like site-specific DNA recombinase